MRIVCKFVLLALLLPAAPALAQWEGPTVAEQALLDSIKADKLIKAREQAEKILQQDPRSIVGRYGLAMVFHDEEANLPRALYNIRLAEKELVARVGKKATTVVGEQWHKRILLEQATVLGEMDRRGEQVRVMDRHDALYLPRMDRYRIWPLMKMHRFKEAQALARKVALSEDLYDRITGLNGLIAIESERLRPRECYKVGMDAVTQTAYQSCILNQNTSEAAFAVYQFAEAENLSLKSIQAPIQDCPASAYPHLANLYLLRADFQRAMEAVKSAREAHVERRYRQQFETSNSAWLARLLYSLGQFQRALELGERIMRAPDRVGMTSFSDEVMRVIYATDYHALLRAQAVNLAEQASVRPLVKQPALWAGVADLLGRAWIVQRRIGRLLTRSEDLEQLVRPYLKPLPPWNSGALIESVGPGVVLQALSRARGREPVKDRTQGYFDALEGEIAHGKGELGRAVELGRQAAAQLPTDEVLMRHRVMAYTADALRRLGQAPEAEKLFHEVLSRFPTALRMLDVPLPASVVAGTSAIDQEVARRLLGSRRLAASQGYGFVVRVTGKGWDLRVCLEGPGGRRYACADARPEEQARGKAGKRPKQESDEELADRVCDRFHQKVFAPKIDLTQRDINSLDGSAVRGDADQVLREVLGE